MKAGRAIPEVRKEMKRSSVRRKGCKTSASAPPQSSREICKARHVTPPSYREAAAAAAMAGAASGTTPLFLSRVLQISVLTQVCSLLRPPVKVKLMMWTAWCFACFTLFFCDWRCCRGYEKRDRGVKLCTYHGSAETDAKRRFVFGKLLSMSLRETWFHT